MFMTAKSSATVSSSAGKNHGQKDVSARLRRQITSQLRKTRLCEYQIQGHCQFGSSCAFAHSSSELQHTPDLYKTQLCKNFGDGRCTDKDCPFAHGDTELRSTDPFFKKSLCMWFDKGKCRNGEQCRFAHGKEQLHVKNTIAMKAEESRTDGRSESMFVEPEYFPIQEDMKNVVAPPRDAPPGLEKAEPPEHKLRVMVDEVGRLKGELAALQSRIIQRKATQGNSDAPAEITATKTPLRFPTALSPKAALSTKARIFVPQGLGSLMPHVRPPPGGLVPMGADSQPAPQQPADKAEEADDTADETHEPEVSVQQYEKLVDVPAH